MHALSARIIDRRSIALRDLTPRIEQSPVQIQREQTYRHKEKTRYTKGTKSTKRDIMRAPLQQNLEEKRDAKTRNISSSDCPGVGLLVCLCAGLQKNQRDFDRVRGDPVSGFDHW